MEAHGSTTRLTAEERRAILGQQLAAAQACCGGRAESRGGRFVRFGRDWPHDFDAIVEYTQPQSGRLVGFWLALSGCSFFAAVAGARVIPASLAFISLLLAFLSVVIAINVVLVKWREHVTVDEFGNVTVETFEPPDIGAPTSA